MIALSAYATYRYLIYIPVLMQGLNINLVTLLLIVAPPAAGATTTFFLFKPLLVRKPKQPEVLELDESVSPTLYAFVRRLCKVLGAPMPSRIEIDLQANASARLRKGWVSLITSDLSLRIGLPLAAGLTVRQFAGVLAHEFGHFTQRAGMRLYFLVESIRYWFARVAYERDQWDEALEEWKRDGGWRTKIILGVASGTVYVSRAVLRGLFHAGNWISAWFSRQMEFDADRNQAALVGADTVGDVLVRITELSGSTQSAWETVERGWGKRRLADDFAEVVRYRDAQWSDEGKQDLSHSVFAEVTERGSTHPSARDRVENVRGMEGIVPESAIHIAELPAEVLFDDFASVCRRATQTQYRMTVGEKLEEAVVLTATDFIEERRHDDRRSEALASTFHGLTMPSRWFRLAAGSLDGEKITVYLTDEDQSAQYWKLLEESVNRNSGLEFVRAGGKIDAHSFWLSSADKNDVEVEAAQSRTALAKETERLRSHYKDYVYLISQEPGELREAYAAISEAQDRLLELRFDWVAAGVMQRNSPHLPEGGVNIIAEMEQRVTKRCVNILDYLSRVPFPALDSVEPHDTLQAYVLGGADASAMAAAELGERILARADMAAELFLAELCARSRDERAASSATAPPALPSGRAV
ncbi:MAG: M48 family metallopeptidase [Acidobacteriota bacterium]